MEHLKHSLTGIGQPAKNSQKNSKAPSKQKLAKLSWIVALFKQFEAIWADKWLRNLETDEKQDLAFDAWGRGIADLTAEEIRAGIDGTALACEWPPSIKEFRDHARPARPAMQAYHARHKTVPGQKKITSAKSDEVRKSELAKMKEVLPG